MDGAFHHVAVVKDDGVRILVDGDDTEAGRIAPAEVDGHPVGLRFGRRADGTKAFPGVLDELMIFDRALTDDEIGRLDALPALDPDGDGTCSAGD